MYYNENPIFLFKKMGMIMNNTLMSNSGDMNRKLLIFIEQGWVPERQGKEKHMIVL